MQQATQSPTPDAAALRAQIREQVRQQVQAAREQARQAVQQAEQAQHGVTAPPAPGPIPGVPDIPEIPQIPGTQPPFIFDTGMRMTVEHIAIGFFVMVASLFFIVPIARAFARRIVSKPVVAPLDQGLSEQLKRIENSVDSMAIEIERISEAQRYMVRLQSDRGASTALPSQQAAG